MFAFRISYCGQTLAIKVPPVLNIDGLDVPF
jgi:hypothetical protein